MHEFQLLDDGETAVLSSYNIIPYDLSVFNITTGLGWISEGVFQEVNVTSGELIFEWHSSLHVTPSESQITPDSSDTGGDGFSPHTAFDYFHINAIDRTPAGNYLVSSRHTSTIYHINGTTGSIIWRLSYQGDSDFNCTNFNFSFQHDVRYQSSNTTTTLISIFDNASNGPIETRSQSSGKRILLDHDSNTATRLSETLFPTPGGLLSTSQGNTQILPNGGTFHSWGNNPYVTEHAANGTAVLLAQFAASTAEDYRAFSSLWDSTPATTVPDVYAYAQSLNTNSSSTANSTRIYVSWNGATSVTSWRFYGGDANADACALTPLGETARTGFETLFVAQGLYPRVRVEALDVNGAHLRNSSVTTTFAPGPALAGACGAEGCAVASTYSSG